MLHFIRDLYRSRALIWELAKKDFKTKYVGSFLGVLWAFVQPVITILIYWYVFQVGFKSVPVADFPFILWLMAGLVPWFFISESIGSAASSIVENSYLVKKVVFRVSILPLIKIIAALFVHLFFIAVLISLFLLYGYSFEWYYLQVIYYLIATVMFVLSLSWITSSLNVFLKDVGQVIGMLLQFFFWLTPIFWALKIVPDKYQFYFKLNPVYYIVEGYRDTFIHKVWFWEHPVLTIYFWLIVSVFSLLGFGLYKKLRLHFADVL